MFKLLSIFYIYLDNSHKSSTLIQNVLALEEHFTPDITSHCYHA